MAETRKTGKAAAKPAKGGQAQQPAARSHAPRPGGKLAKGAAARREAERARRRRTIVYTALTVAVLAAAVGVIVLASYEPPRDEAALAAARSAAGCGTVQELPEASRQHISATQQPQDWNSNPPTSGSHIGDGVLPRGFSEIERDQRLLVHNLEHGYVAIQWKNLPQAQVEQLRRIAREYEGQKLIVQPYAALERDGLALTAWQHLQTCERVNEEVIKAFIDDFMVPGGERSRAPEPGAA